MNKHNNLVLVGGGGHAKACYDVIVMENKFKVIGYFDKSETQLSNLDVKYLGDDSIIDDYILNHSFLVCVGQIKNSSVREKIFNNLRKKNAKIPSIISPLSYVSPSSKIGDGTIIMHGVIIQSNSSIGNNCIINDKALIEHDCIIKDNTHISTSVTINGDCIVGSNTFIGSGTIINNGISISSNKIIPSGELIKKNI